MVLRPSMVGALRIDRIGDLLFRAVASREPTHHRIFGGQIMAQALLAAGRTVAPSLDPHLLHARFFRPGEPNRDVDYQIGPFTDRGSFAYRQVVARQGDRQIMELTASFHRTEDGPEHQFPACAEADPEGLPTFGDLAANSSDESARNQPFEKASQHMHQPMEGVRVLEVAQFTFVPAAAAVLSDWGAEVIKVEHAVTGDAQRGLVRVLGLDAVTPGSSFYPIMEGPNRGKRSIGLALDKPEVRPVLEALIKQSDVFLTNYLPSARRKLGIDVQDVRAVNPDIIYVRGSGYGVRGEDADKGGYDSTAFWARAGSAAHVTPPDSEQMCHMPTGAYGDSLGGMTIAGGISAALYRRAMTGETSIVDVSLLSVGAWAMQFGINLAMMTGGPLPEAGSPQHGASRNPLSGTYKTSDGRWIMLTMLQPGRFWAEFVTLIGRPDLVTDPRFDTTEKLMANAPAAGEILAEVLRTRTYKEWTTLFETMTGPWSPVQDAWEVSQDKMLRANGFIAKLTDADGKQRELVTSPVQFDEVPQQLTRGPQFAEHTDEILKELGITDEEAIQLKIAGAVT